MKVRKIAAIVLSCSLILGQAAYAAEPQSDTITTTEKSIDLSDNITDVLTTEQLDNEDAEKTEAENIVSVESISQDSAQQLSEESGDAIRNQSNGTESRASVQELKLYVDYDRIIEVNCGDFMNNFSESAYQVEVDDLSICSADIIGKEGSNLSVQFHLLNLGNTTVKISGKEEGNKSFSTSYAITVAELPEDAVPFKDIVLRSVLLEHPAYDENGDEYISKNEIAQISSLSFSNWRVTGITDVSGLEYAAKLGSISLSGNLKLCDITPLYQLENLTYCDIRGTGVPDEERWKLADFKDFEMNKGEKLKLPEKYCFAETSSDFSVEIIDNVDCVKLEDNREREGIVYLTALEPGKVKVKISYKTFISEITITINGLHSAQEVGEDYTELVDIVSGLSEREGGSLNSSILKSNGEFWEVYPESKKVRSNVKKYVAEWIYRGKGSRDAIPVKYMLDFDDTLWNGDKELATDVEKFDSHYALDSQGVLKDLYNEDTESLCDVVDWVVVANGSRPVWVYVLKTDGTLWGRQEVSAEEKSNPFTQLAESVAEICVDGFLSLDGKLYRYTDFKQPVATEVQEIGIIEKGLAYDGRFVSYYGTDGCFYVMDETKWNGSQYEYCRVGEIDVQDYKRHYKRNETGYYEEWIILSKTGELYRHNVNEGLTQIDSDVKEFNVVDLQVKMYKKNDGSCYTLDKEKAELSMENPYIITRFGELNLADIGNDNNIVVKNGVAILDHVVKIWRDNDQQFALRTDGTVWNITEVPKLVLDLATNTYVKGDVNEDGYVNIEDLRIVLRGVCGKIDLTERQVMIADVESDGSVDIQDLRKILRYVCGKITEL